MTEPAGTQDETVLGRPVTYAVSALAAIGGVVSIAIGSASSGAFLLLLGGSVAILQRLREEEKTKTVVFAGFAAAPWLAYGSWLLFARGGDAPEGATTAGAALVAFGAFIVAGWYVWVKR